MKYIVAHDIGTSGNKASLFSEEGKLIGSEVSNYETKYFDGNSVEQNAQDWWDAVCDSTKRMLDEYKINPDDIAAISFSGQMMGCLCVDESITPLRNAIIWADQRATKQAEEIGQHISQKDFYNIVGHMNTPSYGVQKLMWIKENEPDVYQKTYKALNAKDFIIAKLTGNVYTDYSDGNSFACFDLKNLKWSDEIIGYAGIDKEKLPELKPSTFIAGGVLEEAAKETGLAVGTPVVVGAGDGVTASVGAGSIEPGRTYCSLGTSAWVTTTTKEPVFSDDMNTVTWAHAVPGYYAPNGTMQTAGGAMGWLKEQVAKYESYLADQNDASAYEYINEQIESAPVGSNNLIFLPYLLGERAPRWDENAKGAFVGIKAETTRAEMMRSVMEGVTLNLSIILEELRKEIEINELTVVSGGAKSSVWRQIMADIFDVKLNTPEVLEEASSMGAAIIGGVGAGVYKDFTVIDDFLKINSVTTPNSENNERYNKIKELFDEIYFALKPVFPKF
ncbi:xylulokinase [Oceanobacillus jeddahense]|uniref:Xylulose kinase n=1 Tax=Oceanobacillus jeddahense TaxID=1462527 RepID=A0ABY5JQE6_9BACI|nr:xylulokinase [Oceanobacillus jeddahense]UUI02326.1 xylulokinase [Oceanobacillus jeddahense]